MIGIFGLHWTAGFGIAIRLELLLIPIIFGVGGALIAIVGANVGANKLKRAVQMTWKGTAFSVFIVGITGLIFSFYPELWSNFFTHNPQAIDAAEVYLKVVAPFYAFFALGLGLYFVCQAFNTLFWPVVGTFLRLIFVVILTNYLLTKQTEVEQESKRSERVFEEKVSLYKQILLARVSYAGELGWEIHAKNEDMSLIYEKVLSEGATPFGMFALDSLRVEKGYRAWKGDLSTDYSLLESGLERFIKFDKKEVFPGKQSLLTEKQRGSVKKFVSMIIKDNVCDAPYMSTIWHDGKIIGEVTSGAYGHRVNASIALGMVKTDLAISGQTVSVDIFGNDFPAIIQNSGPLWDPNNEVLKV